MAAIKILVVLVIEREWPWGNNREGNNDKEYRNIYIYM